MQDWRPTLFALRAFHVEIASIADHAKEALVVPMRMQWWRDAVNSLYKGTPIRHPVIQCLAQVHMDQLDSEHVHRGTPHRCINCECCQAMPTNMASRRERFLTAQPKCPLLTSCAAMQSTLFFCLYCDSSGHQWRIAAMILQCRLARQFSRLGSAGCAGEPGPSSDAIPLAEDHQNTRGGFGCG